MKVASIFIGMPVGGAEDLAIGLANDLASCGIETHFVCLRSLDLLGEELAAANRSITLLPAAKSKRFSPSGMKHLTEWLQRERIDLVHSHTYHAHTYAIPAARRAGIPSILHHHKTLEKMKWHRWWTMRGLMRRSARVLALSEKTAQDIRSSFRLPDGKVHALPNAVNEALFFPLDEPYKKQIRQSLGLPIDRFLFVTVASLQEVKNHNLLLNAAELWHQHSQESQPAAEFVFLGAGPLRQDLECRVRSMPGNVQVRIPGPQRPIAPWLQCADAFVLPSKWEGQSLALLQAIRCGLPVLASCIEGNTAVLGKDHPGLFALEKPKALASLLDRCRTQPAFRDELIALQNQLPLPTWHELVEEVREIYDSVAHDHRGSVR